MGKWENIKLEKVCKIVKGEQLNKLQLDSSGDYACINGGIEPSGYTNKWNSKENTITISEGGNSCGFVSLQKEKFWSGGHCYTLNDLSTRVDSNFIYYALKGRENLIMSLRVGSGLPNIQQKSIREFQFLLPEDKTEQKKISEVLASIDAAIANTERIVAKTQRIKNGLIQDLLMRGIDDKGNLRSKITNKFITKDNITVPEEWDVKPISFVLTNIEQGWSPNCDNDEASTDEWGVLKTTAVTWEGFNEKENKRLPAKLLHKSNYEIKENDVLITRAGPNSRVGVVAFVKKSRNKLILSDKLYRLIPNNKILPKFLALALSNPVTQHQLSNLKTGMAESQTNISQAIVKSLIIPLPSPKEQSKIIGCINSIESVLDSFQAHLDKLRPIRVGLMQDLLSGKVRVN